VTRFVLLVLINACVGATVGVERILIPLLDAPAAFIATFGATKAIANLYAGDWAQRIGRRPVLLLGLFLVLPVPLVLAWAPWGMWIVGVNALLGIGSGIVWSMTAVMQIDLLGGSRHGLAVGLNDLAGYASIAGMALLAAGLGAGRTPFLLAGAAAGAALLIALAFVREIKETPGNPELIVCGPGPWNQLWCNTVQRPGIGRLHQAGFVKHVNDAVIWGVLPVSLAVRGVPLVSIGIVVAAYPIVWGLCQPATGYLSDRLGRSTFIVGGMILQAGGIALLAGGASVPALVAASALAGLGTALSYPVLTAAVADLVPSATRPGAIGTFRFWRDVGYVAGAVGVAFLPRALLLVAALTALSGLLAAPGRKK
jgi:MFS family permease